MWLHRFGRHRSRAVALAGVVAGLLLLTLSARWLRDQPPPEPTYAGKTLGEWFDHAGSLSQPVSDPSVRTALAAMEGDAIPFLLREIERHSPAFRAHGPLSQGLRWFLRRAGVRPGPGVPGERAKVALELCLLVAEQQRKAWSRGIASRKPSITNLVPAFLRILAAPPSPWVEEGLTVAVIHAGGPLFAGFAAELIQAVQANRSPSGLGDNIVRAVGSGVTNAVPLLVAILEDARQRDTLRREAAAAIGRIAAAGQETAAPLLDIIRTALVLPAGDLDDMLVASFALAVNELPSSPIPYAYPYPLPFLARNQIPWYRARALAALWNRFPEDAALEKAMRARNDNPDP